MLGGVLAHLSPDQVGIRGARRIPAADQQPLRLLGLKVRQLLRVDRRLLELQRGQTGGPESRDHAGLIGGAALGLGVGEQALARRWVQIGLEGAQCTLLVDPPVELSGADGPDGVTEGREIEVASAQRLIPVRVLGEPEEDTIRL